MTKEEIRAKYLAAIEEKILAAEMLADNPIYDKLYELINIKKFGYNLFHPMTKGELSNFDVFCDIASWINYCWDDDGSTSLVCTTIKIPMPEEFIKMFPDKKHFIMQDDIFLMRGDCCYLDIENVKKYALRHDSHNSVLVEYTAILFRPATLDYLHSLIPSFERINRIGEGKINRNDVTDYYKEYDKIIEDIKNYMLSQEHLYSKKCD